MRMVKEFIFIMSAFLVLLTGCNSNSKSSDFSSENNTSTPAQEHNNSSYEYIDSSSEENTSVEDEATDENETSNTDEDTSDSTNTSSGNNTPTPQDPRGQLIDSAIQGVDYATDSKSGVTDGDGYFTYADSDTKITFKVGELTLADFNLSRLNSDKKILPTDLVGVERNNTTDKQVLKLLRVIQSLDEDSNPSNGIVIDDNTKNSFTTDIKLFDTSLADLKTTLLPNANKKLILEKPARDHFKATLSSMGIATKDNPFVIVWRTTSGKRDINITVNSNYNYNYTVDWGDGTSDSNQTGQADHTYSSDGDWTVKISGTFPAPQFASDQLVMIAAWGDMKWKSMYYGFNECKIVDSNATDTPILTSVTSLEAMFRRAYEFNYDIGDWNTSNITNMKDMFVKARKFNQDIGDWEISKVTNMIGMFYKAYEFNQDIGAWNTSKVGNMKKMFYDARKFNQNISGWNVSNVTTMEAMFKDATNFNQNLDSWAVAGSVTKTDMFLNSGMASSPPSWYP